MIGAIEEALGAAGLPPLAWYDALLPLKAAGRPLRMGELAGEVVTTIGRTGLTRLVDRLETAGMVTREHSSSDRRGVEVAITAAGAELLRRMWPVYASVIEEYVVAGLDESAATRLAADLRRLAKVPQDEDGTTAS